MNTIVVARKLNERRLRPNPVMTTGEIISTIGAEGMQEAINRNWLVPDLDTGFMMVNMNAGKLAEVEEACRCPECKKPECNCESLKAERSQASLRVMPLGIRENWAGFGVGGGSNGGIGGGGVGGAAPMMPRPQPASPTTPPDKRNPQIGDDVMLADEGQTYTGKVSTVGQDGRYRLSFGNNKPRMDREYGPEEIRLVGQAAPPPHA